MKTKARVGIITFFVVAFGGPWLGWTLIADSDLSLLLFPAFCSAAAFAAAYAEAGHRGLKAFVTRTIRISGVGRWIVLAYLTPLLLGISYLAFNLSSIPPVEATITASFCTMLLMALWTGPLAEEFGWRGYLQPRLTTRFSPIVAALIVGVLWCAWHLPLFYSTVFSTIESSLGFLAFCVTWSVFMAYFVGKAQWSVWPAVALHWSANTHASILGATLPSIGGGDLPGGPNSTIWYLAGAALFVLAMLRFFTTRTEKTVRA